MKGIRTAKKIAVAGALFNLGRQGKREILNAVVW